MKTDVLIAGAGPVGLTMAVELTRYGLSVRIVEKAAQRTDKSKALVLWSRTLELMDRAGATAPFLAAGFKATAANIADGREEIARITFDGVVSPHPYALMLPQSETERILEEHLATLGVPVEREVELTGFADGGAGGVSSMLRHADGREEAVEASWLIGCDGAHSTVRHQLGMEFHGDTMISDWILADLHLTGVPHPGEISVVWHADGVLAIFPISQDRYRVIADAGNAEGRTPRPDPTLDEVQAVLDRRGPGGIAASAPIWLAAFRINERKVEHYRAGRVFLAGDAAHIHSPAGGQGMNTGMQDACNLAWKLALVTKGHCADALLDSYSIERSAVGDKVLKAAGRTTTIGIMRGAIRQSVRNHIASLLFGLSAVRNAAADALTELFIGYPDSPLTVPGGHSHGGPAAGERAPIRSGEPLVGAGDSPRFALFAAPDNSAEWTGLLARYPDLLEPHLREPFEKGGLWLVRPDGYVALTAKANEWEKAATYLDAFAPARP